MIKRLLIANRGEIACRIIHTAKRMGITTLAVYSDVDNHALFVSLADEAYYLGPAPALESYLCIEKIIQLALKADAQAIHPGYGFLAENAEFAAACEQAGLIFVGPKSAQIRAMGLKDEAKRLAAHYGCPVLPQYDISLTENLSFPLLIKPIAGGGGKGMQVVEHAGDFPEKLAAAKRLALASFGNGAVILEKYLPAPRHIEIQVLADQMGHAVYLFERDCSMQRRYQKIIEQAPALNFSQNLRSQMGEAALKIVRGLGYVGAGTVEFLLDERGEFYFMEMNTRLQVEHGVSELITGVDLVEWQLRIASGEPLTLQQASLAIHGTAIEARLYAEDPSEDFLPSTGEIAYLTWPTQARVDKGIQVGDAITIYYDPLLAKILVHAPTHQAAWVKLSTALQQLRIAGVKTNLNFLRQLSENLTITTQAIDTHYIDMHQSTLCQPKVSSDMDLVLVAMAIILQQNTHVHSISPWQRNTPWRLNAKAVQQLNIYHAKKRYEVQIEFDKAAYHVTYEHHIYTIKSMQLDDEHLHVEINDQEYLRTVIFQAQKIWLLSEGYDLLFTLEDRAQGSRDLKNEGTLRAPMPGKIVQVLVAKGDNVVADQALMVLEAMKMEHTLRAPYAGVIKAILFQVGDQVQEETILAEMEK
ncbi:MAG TPA: biotin carboxylase N-terminal domain-containing protein [Gammaproteobacteria bacterium]|nr:biotin carboxylase N-terminal domain-containing protein [Gammaproteobacteria bacterium]